MNRPTEAETGILINVNFEKKDGWHIATSPELPGFILADLDIDEIIDDLPEAIRVLYSHRHNIECGVVYLKRADHVAEKDEGPSPWALIPMPVINSMAAVAA